jgi:hypothetical protein
MSMNPQERAEFVNAYTQVLITAWSDERFSNRLDADPLGALRECGIELPAGSRIRVIRAIPDGQEEGSLDAQIEAWEQGRQTGQYEMHVPYTPQLDTSELTEGDLDSIAAGGSDTYCSCCCPCCCTS